MNIEDFLDKNYFHMMLDFKNTETSVGELKCAFKEYTKMKCGELLEILAEKSRVSVITYSEGKGCRWEVDKDSILNAVDLNEFIK